MRTGSRELVARLEKESKQRTVLLPLRQMKD